MSLRFRHFIKRCFNSIGLKVQRYDKTLPEIWSNVTEYQKLYKEIEYHTIVYPDRCFMLYQAAKNVSAMDGEIAEVGVYKGGTGKLIAKTCRGKTIHLFDTFSGTPNSNPYIDFHKKGDLSDTSVEKVQEFLKDCDNVIIHPGLFPSSAEGIKDKVFCLVHVDVGLYQSIKDCLEFFYSKVISGGIIIFEGYEWTACPGAKKAINEFLIDKPETPVITTRRQCMLTKHNSR